MLSLLDHSCVAGLQRSAAAAGHTSARTRANTHSYCILNGPCGFLQPHIHQIEQPAYCVSGGRDVWAQRPAAVTDAPLAPLRRKYVCHEPHVKY